MLKSLNLLEREKKKKGQAEISFGLVSLRYFLSQDYYSGWMDGFHQMCVVINIVCR